MALLKVTLIVLFGAATVIGAIATLLWGPHARARRRLREGTAAIADRELVTLTGTVHALGEPLVAPLSGKSCVAYEASARVAYAQLDATGSNEDVLEARAMQPFALLLASGERVLVDGDRAELAARPAPVIPRVIEHERDFLAARDIDARYLQSTRFEEAIVEPGARVRVQGMAIVESDDSATTETGYRDMAPRRVRVVAHANHPLTIG